MSRLTIYYGGDRVLCPKGKDQLRPGPAPRGRPPPPSGRGPAPLLPRGRGPRARGPPPRATPPSPRPGPAPGPSSCGGGGAGGRAPPRRGLPAVALAVAERRAEPAAVHPGPEVLDAVPEQPVGQDQPDLAAGPPGHDQATRPGVTH